MLQEEIAGKILVELMELGIVNEDNEILVYNYLMQAYAAGHDDCRSTHKSVRVAQYDFKGKLIAIYPSIKSAAKEMKVSPSAIGHAIRKNAPCNGWKWIKVDIKNGQDNDRRIGSRAGAKREG